MATERGLNRTISKEIQKKRVLEMMINRGKKRFVTPYMIARKLGLSKETVTNYLCEFSNSGVCESIRVLSSDGTCAWGLSSSNDLFVGGSKSPVACVVQKRIALHE